MWLRRLISIFLLASPAMAQTAPPLTLTVTITPIASTAGESKIVIQGQTGAVLAWLAANDPACKLSTNGEFSCASSSGGIGSAGPAGPQGGPGPEGPQGATGATGPTGPQGKAGAAGPIGATGQTGPQGISGPAGATGSQGVSGPAGGVGAVGPQGPPGPSGAVGSGIFGTPSPAALAALPAGANGIAMDETPTPGKPAPGVDYLRADSVNHCIMYSHNGSAEACLPLPLVSTAAISHENFPSDTELEDRIRNSRTLNAHEKEYLLEAIKGSNYSIWRDWAGPPALYIDGDISLGGTTLPLKITTVPAQ